MKHILVTPILLLFGLILVGAMSMIVISLIPSSAQQSAIGASIEVLKKEGVYPVYGLPFRPIVKDNFTDALMLNTAFAVDSSKPVYAAFVNNRAYNPETIADQIGPLEALYKGEPVPITGYERYWHGYQTWLRPALTLFSYSSIRILLTISLLILFSIYMLLAWKKLGMRVTVSALAAFLFVDFFYLGQSIQFSSVFLIGLCGGIYVLRKNPENVLPVFLVVGALTSFFDLLTAPLVSLGILLATVASQEKRTVQQLFVYCLYWATGYASMWAAKWVLAEYLFAPGAISNAFQQVATRTVAQADPNFSHFNAIKLNIMQLVGYHKVSKFAVAGTMLVAGGILIMFHRITRDSLKKILPWVFMAVLPYAWYVIAANHSYLHVWFTYRAQYITVFAGLMAYVELLDLNKVKSFLRRYFRIQFPEYTGKVSGPVVGVQSARTRKHPKL